MAKKKKEKITYYDDGSTISDMSEVGGIGRRAPNQKPAPPPKKNSTFKEKWDTYWNAVKMMFFPMLVALLVLSVIFLLLYLL
ncbi:MAG: hypothetical protein IJX88_05725 [Clostridia bacterium]|nr:hypothetical protein [Clostridia bacterium]